MKLASYHRSCYITHKKSIQDTDNLRKRGRPSKDGGLSSSKSSRAKRDSPFDKDLSIFCPEEKCDLKLHEVTLENVGEQIRKNRKYTTNKKKTELYFC